MAVIGLIFCFFMLWLSFTANIRENAWEYGVLRALGLTASTVLRLYIYEALVIVLACLILGCELDRTVALAARGGGGMVRRNTDSRVEHHKSHSVYGRQGESDVCTRIDPGRRWAS